MSLSEEVRKFKEEVQKDPESSEVYDLAKIISRKGTVLDVVTTVEELLAHPDYNENGDETVDLLLEGFAKRCDEKQALLMHKRLPHDSMGIFLASLMEEDKRAILRKIKFDDDEIYLALNAYLERTIEDFEIFLEWIGFFLPKMKRSFDVDKLSLEREQFDSIRKAFKIGEHDEDY